MYRKFEALLKERGLSTYKVSQMTHISQSTFSDWKNGKSVPKQDKIDKISLFFNVDSNLFKNSSKSCHK